MHPHLENAAPIGINQYWERFGPNLRLSSYLKYTKDFVFTYCWVINDDFPFNNL